MLEGARRGGDAGAGSARRPPTDGATSIGPLLALVLAARLTAVVFLKPGGTLIDSIGDFGFYRDLAELSLGGRLPYRDFWIEYPPLFPFALVGLYRASLGLPGWPSATAPFNVLLGGFLLACECINVLLVRRIAARLHGPAAGERAALLYAAQPFALLAGLAWFDAFPLLFLLLALDAGLAGRGGLAGAALGLGALAKVLPLAVGPAVVGALSRPPGGTSAGSTGPSAAGWRLGAAAAAGALVLVVVLAPIARWPFAEASLQATLNRSSWESVWALLEGYWRVGTVAPIADRFDPAAALRELHPATLPWGLIAAAHLLVMLTLCMAPRGPRQSVAIGGLGLLATLLFARGYSPQFLVYLLPLLIILWPGWRGVGYSLLLTALNLLEWPITLSLFPDRRELIVGAIGLRTLVWLWLVVEMMAEVWPRIGGVFLPARRRLGAAAAVGVGTVLVWMLGAMAGMLGERGEHAPVLAYLGSFGAEAPVVASSSTAFYRLVPTLGASRTTLARDAGPRVERSSHFWLVLDHSEGDPEARATLERDLGQHGSRATDRWFGYYRLLGFVRSAAPLTTVERGFGDALTLTGWGLEGQRLQLAWRVRAQPPADYKAFAHVLAADGSIAAQEDRPLDHRGRPASQWRPGDATLTALDLPEPTAGRTVRIGLYHPATGARLAVGSGDSFELR